MISSSCGQCSVPFCVGCLHGGGRRVLSVLENSALSSENKWTCCVLLKLDNCKFVGGVHKTKELNGSDSRVNQMVLFMEVVMVEAWHSTKAYLKSIQICLFYNHVWNWSLVFDSKWKWHFKELFWCCSFLAAIGIYSLEQKDLFTPHFKYLVSGQFEECSVTNFAGHSSRSCSIFLCISSLSPVLLQMQLCFGVLLHSRFKIVISSY